MLQSHLKYTNQYDFLEKEGYLIDSNDATLLEEGKKAYRRWYKREHRKNSKKFHPEILVLLPDNEALSFIKEKSREYNKSMSNLLWTAAEAYLKNKYLHINQSRIESIQQSLKLAELHIRQVQELAEEDSQPMMYNFDMILERVINLEEEIKNTLDKPKIIEEAIQSLLIQEPWQKTKLLNLIQSY